MPFEFFDHTGDIGVELTAESLEGLFEAAAEAFTAAVCDLDRVEARPAGRASVEAASLDLLLVDWLAELLYRFEVKRLLVRRARVSLSQPGDRCRLDAILWGETVDEARHHITLLVKGVTYHGLHVIRAPEGWRARVILDI